MKNRRLAQQMERRPAVMAALKLKKVGGVTGKWLVDLHDGGSLYAVSVSHYNSQLFFYGRRTAKY